ncbi:hypothetical protein [Phytomonospora endophytica]|uniref:Uncharacterized protein n=1 Tax=Phytomonospora endophytica TaxID=714109 RepID=A0A841G478_9ACTN|nr:hypothetical protein [Phytomonospora endophytica]MBB6039519.1 hypothetical protein [Phytomonospora endophytica]GIG70483.1 hypothetical protein Pen01_67780 [Phytomonospora endophytica]
MPTEPDELHARFAADIAALKGKLTWTQVQHRIRKTTGSPPPSVSILSAAAAPDPNRPPTWNTVRLLVTALLHDKLSQEELGAALDGWRRRWEAFRQPVAHDIASLRENPPPPVSAPPARPRRTAAIVIATSVVAAVVGGAIVWAMREGGATAGDEPSSPGSSSGGDSSSLGSPFGELTGWSQIVGPGCEDHYTGHFANTIDGDGWQDTTGGWAQDGCDGAAKWTASPGQSGPSIDSYVWQWMPPADAPGAPAGSDLTCHVEVYVPAVEQAAGRATYSVSTRDNAGSADTRLPGSTVQVVDQSVRRGWIDLGAFTTSDRTFAVTVFDDDRGTAPVALSAARLRC